MGGACAPPVSRGPAPSRRLWCLLRIRHTSTLRWRNKRTRTRTSNFPPIGSRVALSLIVEGKCTPDPYVSGDPREVKGCSERSQSPSGAQITLAVKPPSPSSPLPYKERQLPGASLGSKDRGPCLGLQKPQGNWSHHGTVSFRPPSYNLLPCPSLPEDSLPHIL